jgi:hypothetical protein
MAEVNPTLTDYILGRTKRSAPVEEPSDKTDNVGGKSEIQAPSPPIKKKYNISKIIYSHRRLVSTFGYQYNSISNPGFGDDYGSGAFFISTPYARDPCNLPRGSEVKLCKVKCKPIGLRTPFLTNSTAVNQVNSSVMVHGMYAHGLNNKYGGADFNYTIDSSAPCIPTAISFDMKEDCDPDKL